MSLDPAVIDALSHVSTATITTELRRLGLHSVWMRGPRPLRTGQPRVVGEAFTMRFIPFREDFSNPQAWPQRRSFVESVEVVPPGAVVVVDAMGNLGAGVFGDVMSSRMRYRGVAALVTDGALRDTPGLIASGLPVWCQGMAAPPITAGLALANWQEPVGCGGVAVLPGDIIVLDDDGGVVIPPAALDELIPSALKHERLEAWILGEIAKGAALPGLYPPNADTEARYEAATRAGGAPDR
ncbi:MAG: ribonuclease activity regulator RraA [Dehalococcoidia bacterium]